MKLDFIPASTRAAGLGAMMNGAGTLLRQIHGDWTPPEVRSALQMTAKRTGFKDFVNGTPACCISQRSRRR